MENLPDSGVLNPQRTVRRAVVQGRKDREWLGIRIRESVSWTEPGKVRGLETGQTIEYPTESSSVSRDRSSY